ncbi:UNVERIFIED_ORG: hypothetical protein ABIB13_003870 [Arthrobacter sp. UYEF2]
MNFVARVARRALMRSACTWTWRSSSTTTAFPPGALAPTFGTVIRPGVGWLLSAAVEHIITFAPDVVVHHPKVLIVPSPPTGSHPVGHCGDGSFNHADPGVSGTVHHLHQPRTLEPCHLSGCTPCTLMFGRELEDLMYSGNFVSTTVGQARSTQSQGHAYPPLCCRSPATSRCGDICFAAVAWRPLRSRTGN